MTSVTYLELSEGDAGSHKFYEIAIAETQVTIRFGRIGSVGRSETHTFSTLDEAEKFYQTKIREKTKKGYAPATLGQTEKKAIARKQLTEDDFWQLIEASKTESGGDIYEQLETLKAQLCKLTNAEIVSFDTILHRLLNKSFEARLWGAAYIINGGCSDDGFDYFRGWLIAQGQAIFEQALENPDSLADVVDIENQDVQCEEIWYVAQEAYEEKTGKDDFGEKRIAESKELKGNLADWSDDDGNEDETKIQDLFPRLYAKFWEAIE
ncbi:MAG: DUF4240 domain-containing protein [Oculatellaceae cyanobacterium bins.114]|nr:DUF4240 domain-containing protein [Oculatellaceae cyanobacterium bins.114]